MKLITKWSFLRLFILVSFLFLAFTQLLKMPGESFKGNLSPLNKKELKLRNELSNIVEMLAVTFGQRSYIHICALNSSADFIEQSLSNAGLSVNRQKYFIRKQAFYNIIGEKKGAIRPEEIVVIGAHYDTVIGTGSPGANDNGSGVAALLALANIFSNKQFECTVRFVGFANEEPPFFQTDQMGSLVYAKSCKVLKENIVAMLAFDTIGYYTDKENSQEYPRPLKYFYPSTGNFITFVGNLSSRSLVRKTISSFRNFTEFPSEGATLPSALPGIGWSDHWSFWQVGYKAVMVTDTAPYRYFYYHSSEDTIDKIDFDKMTRVVVGLEKVIADLTGI